MLAAILLFAFFALLSGVGIYLILAHHRGRRAAWTGALTTLLLFAVLLAGLIALFHAGGFP